MALHSNTTKKMNEPVYQPIKVDFSERMLEKLELEYQVESIEVYDTITEQLQELIKVEYPGQHIDDVFFQAKISEKLSGKSIDRYGNWFYYPWQKKLVHLLPEDEFIKVRTNRNKLKITQEQQDELATKHVAIIGLSVGNTVAKVVATERICGEITLADFDVLELSNFNRIQAPVWSLGEEKVIVAARSISEIDPYITIHVWPKGVSTQNVNDILIGNSPVHLLYELCDNIEVKITARMAARKARIPVIMDTNDRGMIDIERFDKEPLRPVFHGLVPEDELLTIADKSPMEKMDILFKLVSFENMSLSLKHSMQAIGKTIRTWPQLASSVYLGAGCACDIGRKILLHDEVPSGRFYVDLDQLIK